MLFQRANQRFIQVRQGLVRQRQQDAVAVIDIARNIRFANSVERDAPRRLWVEVHQPRQCRVAQGAASFRQGTHHRLQRRRRDAIPIRAQQVVLRLLRQ
jgi:hypothetical protein